MIKIRSLLKEENFDLSDNPLSPNKREVSFDDVVFSDTFVSIGDGNHYSPDDFGFADVRGNCYMVDLNGTDSNDDIFPLKKGLTVDKVIKEGLLRKYFRNYYGYISYSTEDKYTMYEWLESLKD